MMSKRVTKLDRDRYRAAYRAYVRGSRLLMSALEALELKVGRKRAMELTRKLEAKL